LIRANYPTPPLQQLRLRLQSAARRTTRAIEERQRGHGADDLRRKRRGYLEFYDQYDALIGLLCLSAHEGIKAEHEIEYRERRAYFTKRYPAVKPSLTPHLDYDSSDMFPTSQGPRPCDAFEALFMPATILAMLESDGGNLIGRMMRTQSALSAWDAALAEEEGHYGILPTPLTSPFRHKKSYRN
jgi:hypothetical protein